MELFDVTIIGGGPAGLYSAFYSGLRHMKTKIIDAEQALGGKLHVYPEKIIWDVGGLGPLTGQALIEQLTTQALTFDPTVVLNEKITSIEKLDGMFQLINQDGEKHFSKTVIVAVGGGILKPKTLDIDGANRLEIDNIHYTLTSLSYFKDRTVVISGGGNAAIDWANLLEPIAKKVMLTYRKSELKGHEQPVKQLLNSSVSYYPDTEITRLVAEGNQITAVELTHCQTKEKVIKQVDDVVVNHGYEKDASLLEETKLPLERVGEFFIKGNSHSETSVPGIFGAGDIISYDGKVNLILGCFQDAANAVNQAKTFLDPDANARAMVSSHHTAFTDKNKDMRQQLLD
ncbi:thioredoxin reductase (NADPH) [Halolactibacillus halophilus]|uniref:Ferredoxin--NADP reductase n=1 Tax=Halolactibacillus halophilus TaxID=306540 RepID=A0A1I5PX18_9BACI|nr:NAD(P)/FAD-dependent oxidoreductase [Halolactibacillus halophilus]GEM02243.1 ferredoxin--NADP reductase 1 [Halolactibacillus halophilus]SFP38633.1 thioredoxin reductase (NADPH) [Halolactibacillus halophilus]